MSSTDSDFEVDQVAVARRAADYVGAVMEAVDSLPVVFAQRRTHRRSSRITMPGNSQLTQLFVRRQLAVTLSRLKSATGLTETAASGQSASAGRLGVLVDAAGAKGSAVVPLVIVLGTIGVMVSLLSIVVPNLQQEAELLGSLPRVVALDGAAVANSATAFDENPAVFSPADLEGVVTALGLAAVVVFGLFSVLAGSAHAAAAILDDPWRYDRRAPFQPSVQRGPVPTQRSAFGIGPQRIHTPVAAGLIRNAALYVAVITFGLLSGIRRYADRDILLLDYFRVGAAELVATTVMLLFPAALLVAYLVVRHRRSTAGRAVPPPKEWRVGIAVLMAWFTGFAFVSAVTGLSGTRLTAGAEYSVSETFPELTVEEFEVLPAHERFMTAGDLAKFRDIENLTVQTLAFYEVEVGSSAGAITTQLLVTELLTAPQFLTAEIDDEAVARLRDSGVKTADGEFQPEVWISDGLAAILDPAQGDQINMAFVDGPSVDARASTVFEAAGISAPVVLLDVADFPGGVDRLLIDELFLRSTDGPVGQDGGLMEQIDRAVDELDNGVKLDLRREFANDGNEVLGNLLLLPITGWATVVIAFGRPRKWRTDQGFAPPATRQGPGLPPPVVSSSSGEPDARPPLSGR